MLFAVIGAAVGGCGFYALYRFAGAITGAGKVSIPWALLFALLPPIALVSVALFAIDQILWTGIGMTAALIVSAALLFSVRMIQAKRQDIQENNEGSEKK